MTERARIVLQQDTCNGHLVSTIVWYDDIHADHYETMLFAGDSSASPSINYWITDTLIEAAAMHTKVCKKANKMRL